MTVYLIRHGMTAGNLEKRWDVRYISGGISEKKHIRKERRDIWN